MKVLHRYKCCSFSIRIQLIYIRHYKEGEGCRPRNTRQDCLVVTMI